MNENVQNNSKIITKVSLVIYCILALIALVILLYFSFIKNQWSFVYGFLLCLGPGLIFIGLTLLLPAISVVSAKLGKAGIVWYCIGFVLKYAAIIGIPFIGIAFPTLFDKWVMLGTTLFAPIQALITKIIFANYVSKSEKKQTK